VPFPLFATREEKGDGMERQKGNRMMVKRMEGEGTGK